MITRRGFVGSVLGLLAAPLALFASKPTDETIKPKDGGRSWFTSPESVYYPSGYYSHVTIRQKRWTDDIGRDHILQAGYLDGQMVFSHTVDGKYEKL